MPALRSMDQLTATLAVIKFNNVLEKMPPEEFAQFLIDFDGLLKPIAAWGKDPIVHMAKYKAAQDAIDPTLWPAIASNPKLPELVEDYVKSQIDLAVEEARTKLNQRLGLDFDDRTFRLFVLQAQAMLNARDNS